ncbi:MAG: hypothetical protein ABEK01_02135, partial [Candidatus Nanohaloarchaea archaeon]
WFDPRPTRDEGTYSFSINAESQATGNVYSTSATVTVVKDHEVELRAYDRRKDACLGEKTRYTVTVTNSGIQRETFDLSFKNAQGLDTKKISQRNLDLDAGQSVNVTVTVGSDTAGDRSFDVRVSSTSSYASDVKTFEHRSVRCFGSDISITPGSQRVAVFNQASFNVTVRNTGTHSDSFVLSTSEGNLSRTRFNLTSGAARTVQLSVSPETVGKKTVTVTADSRVKSSAKATLDVYNGNAVTVGFPENTRKVCENGMFRYDYRITNTGKASDTYTVQVLRPEQGRMTTTLDLRPGQSREVSLTFDAENYEIGKTRQVEIRAESKTFESVSDSATASFTVQNCWDLKMRILPEVSSAGKNMSVVYEIKLNNTGARENTYVLSHEGPEWVSIRPKNITIPAGEGATAYIFAGVPYEERGQVNITARAVGTDVKRTESLQLVIGENITAAIKSNKTNTRFTGQFTESFGNIFSAARGAGTPQKIMGSILLGLLITVYVLYREW